MIKALKDINVKNRRVLVRCDFNVSLNEKEEVVDDFRIKQVLPTINYLIEKKAKVILLSHFKEPSFTKRIGEDRSDFNTSIFPITKCLSKLLKKEAYFINDCIGEKVRERIDNMEWGDVLLLENVRMYSEEKENSEEFGKELSLLGDVYINDALSASHRKHASLARVPQFLESGMGFLFEKELKVLRKAMKKPKKPVVAIVGGAKIESKINALEYFLENADHLLLGGKIANMVLIVRKIAINLEKPSDSIVSVVENINYTSPKLHLPVDVIASKDKTGKGEVRETGPAKVMWGEDIYDIGEETINLFKDIIDTAGTIIWAGPLGLSEIKAFEKGTKEVARFVAQNKKAVKIVGGGDTLKAFRQFDLLDGIDFASSGGGAMLEFLRGGEMPGVDALDKSN